MEEEWINIKGYEGVYLISTLGRIKRIASVRKDGTVKKARILKEPLDGKGYVRIALSKDGVCKKYKIHKLMAENFMSHIDRTNKVIDHINNISDDNRLVNLQFISHRENLSKDKVGRGSSKYIGVWYSKKRKRWVAEISIKSKKHILGYYTVEEEAAKAYQTKLHSIQ